MLENNLSMESLISPNQETESIKELERILRQEPTLGKLVGSKGEEIAIPKSVYQALLQVVHAMALGKAISIVTQEQEMTTQQAANFLNVSRPYLVKLLEQGEIPYMKVGSHRRVNFQDLVKYKEQRDMKRREGIKELTQFLEEEGFYDDSCELDT